MMLRFNLLLDMSVKVLSSKRVSVSHDTKQDI